jgi:SAM-dependent methyltransferase
MLFSVLKLRAGDRVLEVGCGSAEVIQHLASLRPERTTLVGVDSDPLVIEEARRRTAHLSKVDLHHMDGRSLRFGSADFDVVCCTRLLVNSANPPLLVSEMARVLKAGGSLLAIEPLTAFWSGPDLDLRRRVHGQRHATIGGQLPELFWRVGISTQRILTHTFIDDNPRDTHALREEFLRGEGLFAHACNHRYCSREDVDTYLEIRDLDVAGGTFFDGVIHIGILGEKNFE